MQSNPLRDLARSLRTQSVRAVLLAAAVAAVPRLAAGQLSPEESIAKATIAAGLQVTPFASEPMLYKPANIDVDAMGRVWVCEGVNYRKWEGLRKEGDRVVILEDTKGTGRADKSTVFYQGTDVNVALGIAVLGDRVIVSDAPNVFSFTNKDDKPAAKEVFFTGIAGHQHDHAVHKFVFGPDGKLYFNMGNAAQALKHADGTPVVDVYGREIVAGKHPAKRGAGAPPPPAQVAADGLPPYREGMVFRCNPDGSELECLGNNFRNNFMVAVDSFGTLWQSDNDDDGNRGVRINYVMEFGNYGYGDEMTGAGWQTKRTNLEKEIPLRHWHQNDPGVIPNLLQTGSGSPTGICVYEGSLLPKAFWGQVIHCDAGPNVVRSYPVTDSGAGYSAQIVDLIKGGDKWFRPSDVVVAPDGSLFVADWYDPGVGGHAMGDHNWPNVHGRIYRVAPPNTPYKVPPLDVSTADAAVRELTSPNQARRYLAWTALHGMGARAEAALLKLFNSEDPRMRARALWLLAKTNGQAQRYVDLAIKDRDPNLRIVGVRAARQLKVDVVAVVKQLAHDPSPQVRRECAIALHLNQSSDMPAAWAELASQHDGKDRWYLEALGIGSAGRDAECFAAYLAKSGADPASSAGGRDVVWRTRGTNVVPYLQKIILDPATPDEDRPRFVRALDFLPESPEKSACLVAMLNANISDKSVNLEAITRLKDANVPGLREAMQKALESRKGTSDFVDLVDALDLKDRDADLLETVAAHSTDSVGVQAAKLVVKHGNAALVEQSLAGPNGAKVATALGNIPDGSASGILLRLASDPKKDPAVRQAAARALTKTKQGATGLIEFEKKGRLPKDAGAIAGQELRLATWKEIRDQAIELWPPPLGKEAKPLPPIAELIKQSGNAASGHTVFASICAKCHMVGTEGVDLGPALSETGSKYGKDALYENIFYPSAAIAFGYEGKVLKLKNAEQVEGIIASQTADEITLKTAGGIVSKYKRSDVAAINEMKISIMPEGLASGMTQQELVDLVEYLTTLKKPAGK